MILIWIGGVIVAVFAVLSSHWAYCAPTKNRNSKRRVQRKIYTAQHNTNTQRHENPCKPFEKKMVYLCTYLFFVIVWHQLQRVGWNIMISSHEMCHRWVQTQRVDCREWKMVIYIFSSPRVCALHTHRDTYSKIQAYCERLRVNWSF